MSSATFRKLAVGDELGPATAEIDSWNCTRAIAGTLNSHARWKAPVHAGESLGRTRVGNVHPLSIGGECNAWKQSQRWLVVQEQAESPTDAS